MLHCSITPLGSTQYVCLYVVCLLRLVHLLMSVVLVLVLVVGVSTHLFKPGTLPSLRRATSPFPFFVPDSILCIQSSSFFILSVPTPSLLDFPSPIINSFSLVVSSPSSSLSFSHSLENHNFTNSSSFNQNH